jgi:hypothetical protein
LPVGAGFGGRSSRDAHGRFAPHETVLDASVRGDPPAPPHWLGPREVEIYLALWQLPIARLWQPWQDEDVAALASLQQQLEDGERKSWIYTARHALRTSLWLTPKAQRAAKIRIERDERDDDEDEDEDDELPDDEEWDEQLERQRRGEL